MKKRTFLITTLCIVLILYVTPIADARLTPDISVCKRFLDTSDPGPYEMRTPYHWDIEIRVSTDVQLTDANVYDRFGGELKLDHITVPGGPTYTFTYPNYPTNYITGEAEVTISGEGTVDLDKDGISFGSKPYEFFIYWSGKTHKIHFQWIIGTIPVPGEISIIIGVSTDYNPGGQPEFTSPCEHCLNSGAALHGRWRGRRISAYSDRLCVKVECAARLLIDKFDDINGDGILDAGEPRIPGWQVDVTDPLGVVTTYPTPVDLEITEYGAYIITEEIRADWTQTALIVDGIPQTVDPTTTVTVNIGETYEVLYGNTYCPPPGRLIIEKFEDVNGDGVYDVGTDNMLTGWSIDITDPSGDVSTLTTPIDIPITEFGLYSITEDLPAGWTQTAVSVDGIPQAVDPTVTVTVNSGETHTVRYGNWQPPGSLEVKKFHDKDNNGVFDGDDVWLAGWTIYLTDPSGDATTHATPVNLVITEFGVYTVTEDLPAGWTQTAVSIDGVAQAVNPTVTVTVNPGETHTVVYGNWQPPGRLVIKKFNDINGNGVYDDGTDEWLFDWSVDVTDPSGDMTTYLTTVDIAITEFGEYIITEDLPAGWTQTAVFIDDVEQAVNPTVTVTVNPGETHTVLYGNWQPPGSLEIKKFHDKNGNGVFDGDDEWITDWTIYLTDPSGDATTEYTPVSLTITEFGEYIITEDLPAGWEQTVVLVDGVAQALDPTVTVNPGETHNVVYGNRQPGRLVIRKFNDKNNNGVFDAGDEWLSSWDIDVVDPSGDLTSYTTVPIDLVITEFGTYTITEAVPLAWVQTARIVDAVPQSVDPTATVTVNAGESHEVVFGNYKPPPPPIGVSLSIVPISRPVGASIDFVYTITSPPEVTPISVVVDLKPPGLAQFNLYTGTTFPADFAQTITWTVTGPTGLWWAYVTYTYEYLGLTYTAGTFGTFTVTP